MSEGWVGIITYKGEGGGGKSSVVVGADGGGGCARVVGPSIWSADPTYPDQLLQIRAQSLRQPLEVPRIFAVGGLNSKITHQRSPKQSRNRREGSKIGRTRGPKYSAASARSFSPDKSGTGPSIRRAREGEEEAGRRARRDGERRRKRKKGEEENIG